MISNGAETGPLAAPAAASLRSRHNEATRALILDAFLALAHRTNTVAISMPAVAAQAGVSVRTLYRYFPTKDALQTAAALAHSERARAAESIEALDRSSYGAYLTALWRRFAADIPAVAAEHTTPVGRELRTTRLAEARATVGHSAPDLDPKGVDLIIAVTSSSMFLELVDRMGHPPDEAAALSLWLAELILANESPERQTPSNGGAP